MAGSLMLLCVRRAARRYVQLVVLCAACGPSAAPASRVSGAEQETRAAQQPASPPSATPGADEAKPAPSAEPAEPTGGTALVDGVRLSLEGCQVTVEREGAPPETLSLPMAGDCELVHVAGTPQVEQTAHGKTLLVVSSRPLPGRPGDCDTRVRALLVRDGQVAVSKDEQTIRMCGAEGPFDQPMFIVLAASAAKGD